MRQCQRRETFREGTTSFDKLEIGEADLRRGLNSRNERLWKSTYCWTLATIESQGAGRPTSTSHHRSGIQSGLFQALNASRKTWSLDGRNRRVG
jgi:hypothetical protein